MEQCVSNYILKVKLGCQRAKLLHPGYFLSKAIAKKINKGKK
jgi:hypothetical protein